MAGKPRRSKAFLAPLRRQCRLANEADRKASHGFQRQYLDAAMDLVREAEAKVWV